MRSGLDTDPTDGIAPITIKDVFNADTPGDRKTDTADSKTDEPPAETKPGGILGLVKDGMKLAPTPQATAPISIPADTFVMDRLEGDTIIRYTFNDVKKPPYEVTTIGIGAGKGTKSASAPTEATDDGGDETTIEPAPGPGSPPAPALDQPAANVEDDAGTENTEG
jgi:hypothetical protein